MPLLFGGIKRITIISNYPLYNNKPFSPDIYTFPLYIETISNLFDWFWRFSTEFSTGLSTGLDARI